MSTSDASFFATVREPRLHEHSEAEMYLQVTQSHDTAQQTQLHEHSEAEMYLQVTQSHDTALEPRTHEDLRATRVGGNSCTLLLAVPHQYSEHRRSVEPATVVV